MNCPEHPEVELRRENYETGFCLKCLKHYEMCREVEYMNVCDRLKGHEGRHRDEKGREWVGT